MGTGCSSRCSMARARASSGGSRTRWTRMLQSEFATATATRTPERTGLRLYSYFRSSAAYRVRIGLALKGLAYETIPVHLVKDGRQHGARYRHTNPQGLVPADR